MKKKKGGSFLLEKVKPDEIFTPEDFSEEHKLIANTTEKFVQEQVWPVLGEIEKQNFSLSVRLLKEAGELGLLGADVPEAYGGLGLDKISSSLITEKFSLARSLGLSFGAHTGIGTLPIVFFGNETQKQKYLPDLASGKKLAAYALTEPSSGSDALSVRTTAVLSPDGKYYLLNGEKQWITNSAFADLFIVYAKVDGEKFTAFIVERDFPGVSTGPEEKKMGIHGSSTCTVVLQDAIVPIENVLGEVGQGHKIAFNILNLGRFKLAVATVGSAKRAIELAVQYALQRKQFRTPIAYFPLIQEKLAKMCIKTYVAESMIYRIAGMLEANLQGIEQAGGAEVAAAIHDLAVECSIAKVFGSEMMDDVVDEGVQIHGGYGYMREFEIESWYRDARINRIFEGTNEINRLLIPGTLLKKAQRGELAFFHKIKEMQKEKEWLTVPPAWRKAKETQDYEAERIEQAKKIFLMTAGWAVQKYNQRLEKEQEILRDLADIAIEIFAMESAWLRAQKAWQKQGQEVAQFKVNLARAYVCEALPKIERLAQHAFCAMEEGDTLRIQLSILRKLANYEPINEVVCTREIARRVIEAGKYSGAS